MANGDDKTVRNWNIALVVFLVVVAACLIIWRSIPPAVTNDPAFTRNTIPWDIANEQIVYAWIWTNWTATDWILTILAAGTAIGAAVKNAFTAHNQTQEQATKVAAAADAVANGHVPSPVPVTPPASNGVDKWVMALAALTIIAATLDAKMHPGVQADRYRRGDIGLQEALIDYKVSKDQVPLVAAWHRAERILAGLDATPEQKSAGNGLQNPVTTTGQPPPAAPLQPHGHQPAATESEKRGNPKTR